MFHHEKKECVFLTLLVIFTSPPPLPDPDNQDVVCCVVTAASYIATEPCRKMQKGSKKDRAKGRGREEDKCKVAKPDKLWVSGISSYTGPVSDFLNLFLFIY